MEAKLAFLGHVLMENRNGLLVDACLTPAGGHAERLAALAMIERRADRPTAVTLGADKGYDAADFVNELRGMNVRPHFACNTTRRSAIDLKRTIARYIANANKDPRPFVWSASAQSIRDKLAGEPTL